MTRPFPPGASPAVRVGSEGSRAAARILLSKFMSIRYLDSRDIETFSGAMSKAAARSQQFDLATAFLTEAGAKQVVHLVVCLVGQKKKKRARVVVGPWLGVTKPAALRKLQRFDGVNLRIARTPGF